MRIGTGEFSDSLALDDFTGYSLQMIDFFRKYKNVTFEFKTKSSKIGNLLRSNHSGNVVVSWSINPQELIKENEFYCASLKERLDAAAKCIEAGYRVGFHFDPVIYFSGWEKEYRALIKELFEKIKPKDIAWISIGTFRFSPGLKQVIERRFPANRILDEELILGFDDKLRYAFDIRFEVYDKIIKMLSRHSQKLKLYLCMEEVLMWSKLRLKMPKFP
jgi:spore photoproduct lyase